MSATRFGRRVALLGVAALAGALASCGNGWEKCHPARGKVTLDGVPVEGAEVWLFPVDGERAKRNPPVRPFGKTDKDGTFVLTTYTAGDGAPAGQYKARVIWEKKVKGQKNLDDEREATRNVLPAKYADPETSGLAVIILPGDNAIPDFELKK